MCTVVLSDNGIVLSLCLFLIQSKRSNTSASDISSSPRLPGLLVIFSSFIHPKPAVLGKPLMSGTCIHEPHAPSPSLSGFSTPISETPYRRLDGDTPACTPETDLTPTQCVLRNVLSIDTGGPGAPAGGSPTPSDGPTAHFDNSVLKLHEHEACQCGGGAEAGHSPEAGAVRGQSENIRLQSGSGGFLEGLFGCLKPVWTMIGKAYSTEHKHSQEGRSRLHSLSSVSIDVAWKQTEKVLNKLQVA